METKQNSKFELSLEQLCKIIDEYNSKDGDIINIKIKKKRTKEMIEESKQKNRQRALERYYKNKDTILKKKKNRYHNDMEYQQRMKAYSHTNYTKDIEESKRKRRDYYYNNKEKVNKLNNDNYKKKQDEMMENMFVYHEMNI